MVCSLKSLAAGFLSSLLRDPVPFRPRREGLRADPEAGEPSSRGLGDFPPQPPVCGLLPASLFFFKCRNYFPAKFAKIGGQLNWFRGS